MNVRAVEANIIKIDDQEENYDAYKNNIVLLFFHFWIGT